MNAGQSRGHNGHIRQSKHASPHQVQGQNSRRDKPTAGINRCSELSGNDQSAHGLGCAVSAPATAGSAGHHADRLVTRACSGKPGRFEMASINTHRGPFAVMARRHRCSIGQPAGPVKRRSVRDDSRRPGDHRHRGRAGRRKRWCGWLCACWRTGGRFVGRFPRPGFSSADQSARSAFRAGRDWPGPACGSRESQSDCHRRPESAHVGHRAFGCRAGC